MSIETHIEWRFQNNDTKLWKLIDFDRQKTIENEFQDYLNDKRIGEIIYDCFGNHFRDLVINFDKFETECVDCDCENEDGTPECNFKFKLKRSIVEDWS